MPISRKKSNYLYAFSMSVICMNTSLWYKTGVFRIFKIGGRGCKRTTYFIWILFNVLFHIGLKLDIYNNKLKTKLYFKFKLKYILHSIPIF